MSSAAIPFGWIVNADGSYSKPRRGKTLAEALSKEAAIDLLNKIPLVAYCGYDRSILKKEPKRIRQDSKPLMNKLESEYWRILCERYGDQFVKPQALRFKLGNGIWFKPDFTVFECCATGAVAKVSCYEVKGPHAFRGGFENLKVAAGLWPQVQFILVWKENNQWKEQEILP